MHGHNIKEKEPGNRTSAFSEVTLIYVPQETERLHDPPLSLNSEFSSQKQTLGGPVAFSVWSKSTSGGE